MSKSLYIIDGHAHIYAAYYAPMRNNLTAPNGEPTKAVYIFTNMLLGLIEKYSPDMLVVAMDSKAKSFRSEIYPEYKAHRPPMPEDMPSQIGRIEQIVEGLNIPILRLDGYEADDIIGTVAKKAASRGIDVFICSKDKDMLQLLDEHIKMLDIKSGEIIDTDKLLSDKGLTPQQFIDALSLMGDKADNIPGIADVGPKTAIDWISKYGSIDNLFANISEIGGKRGDNLRNGRQSVELSKKLVIIDTQTPIEFDGKQFSLKQAQTQKLKEVFEQLGFSNLLKKINLDGSNDLVEPENIKPKPLPGRLFDDIQEQSAPDYKIVSNTKHNYVLVDTNEGFENFVEQLNKQKIFAFDTETTAISPMRCELVGLSFCWQKGLAYYIPVKAPLGYSAIKLDLVRDKIAPIMANTDIKKIGQNIKYDYIVMENAGIPVKGIYFDTMIASYCLAADRQSHSMNNMAKDFLGYDCIKIDELIGKGKNQRTFDTVPTDIACEYSAEDADITFQLYLYLNDKIQKEPDISKLFFELEMPLVEVLARMELNGVYIKSSILGKMSKEINAALDNLTERIYELSGMPFNIGSTQQLAGVLFDRLGLKSLKSGKTGRSTDAAVLEQLADQHNIVPLIIEYRQLEKLRNTYIDKLGTLINHRTGRVHASFNQTGTVTGRLSSSDPNLQNIPIKTEIGRKIRSAFIAEKTDWIIISADYSQIELRLLAHFSGDQALKKAFNDNIDIHSFVASEVFAVPVEQVSSVMRSNAKAVNFGIIYGQGPRGLSQTTGLSYAEAKSFIDDYFKKYSSIRDFMNSVVADAKKTGFARTIFGRKRNIIGLASKNFNVRSQAERLALNTTIQGSAADLIKAAMIDIHSHINKNNLPSKMILQIHDELVFEVPGNIEMDFTKIICDKMENAIKLDIPLKVDIEKGQSWLGN